MQRMLQLNLMRRNFVKFDSLMLLFRWVVLLEICLSLYYWHTFSLAACVLFFFNRRELENWKKVFNFLSFVDLRKKLKVGRSSCFFPEKKWMFKCFIQLEMNWPMQLQIHSLVFFNLYNCQLLTHFRFCSYHSTILLYFLQKLTTFADVNISKNLDLIMQY